MLVLRVIFSLGASSLLGQGVHCQPSGVSLPAWGPSCPGPLSLRTGRDKQLSHLAALERSSSQRVPLRLGCLKSYVPAVFNILMVPLVLFLISVQQQALLSIAPGSPTSSSSPSVLAGAQGGGKEGIGLAWTRQGREQPWCAAAAVQPARGISACISTHHRAARSSQPCVCIGMEGWWGGQRAASPQLSLCPTDAPCRAPVMSCSMLALPLGFCRASGMDISQGRG